MKMKFITAATKGVQSIVVAHLKDASEHQKCVALNAAIQNGQKHILLTLLRWGVKPLARHLLAAIKTGDEDMVNWLLNNEQYPVSTETDGNITPLIEAVRIGTCNMVDAILKSGASVNVKDSKQRTALQHAARKGNLDNVKLLLAQGQAQGQGNATLEGCAPFVIDAVKKGFSEIVDAFLNAGIRVKDLSIGKKPILMYAVREKECDMVHVLLSHGADPNVSDSTGRHVLKNAIDKRKSENAQALVKYGAQLELKEHQIRVLVKENQWDLFKAAYEAHNAVAEHEIDLVRWFLEAVVNEKILPGMLQKFITDGGVDVNAKDQAGRNAISLAVEAKNETMISWLVGAGAKMEIPRNTLAKLLEHKQFKHFEFIANQNCKETESGRFALNEALNYAVSHTKSVHSIYNVLELLMTQGADPNYIPTVPKHVQKRGKRKRVRSGADFPPLLHAAESGDVEIVRILLDYNADVNIQSMSGGVTPLMRAAVMGDLEIIDMLLHRGANPVISSNDTLTAYQFVVNTTPNAEEVRAKLRYAEDHNLYDNVDISYFPIATKVGFEKSVWDKLHEQVKDIEFVPDEGYGSKVDELMGGRDNMNLADEYGRTFLMFCSFMKYHRFVRHLLNIELGRPYRESLDNQGMSALTWATLGASHESMEFLIEKQAGITAADYLNRTALHRAIQKKDGKACQLLIEAESFLAADLNDSTKVACPHELKGAVVWAAQDNWYDVIRALVSADFKINQKEEVDEQGRTPLMIAAANGFKQVLTGVMPLNINYDLRDDHGRTALWHAMHNNHLDVFETLLQAGASVRKMYGNLSALCVAAIEGRTEYLKLILQKSHFMGPGPDGTSPLMYACKAGHLEIVQLLIAADADVRHSNMQGDFALLYAAEHNFVDIVKALIDAKALVDQCNVHEYTPLLLAAANCFHEVVGALLTGGAEVNKKNSHGIDAIHLAMGNLADPGRALTLQELIAWGADCENVDKIAYNVEAFLNDNPNTENQNRNMRPQLKVEPTSQEFPPDAKMQVLDEPDIDYGQNNYNHLNEQKPLEKRVSLSSHR